MFWCLCLCCVRIVCTYTLVHTPLRSVYSVWKVNHPSRLGQVFIMSRSRSFPNVTSCHLGSGRMSGNFFLRCPSLLPGGNAGHSWLSLCVCVCEKNFLINGIRGFLRNGFIANTTAPPAGRDPDVTWYTSTVVSEKSGRKWKLEAMMWRPGCSDGQARAREWVRVRASKSEHCFLVSVIRTSPEQTGAHGHHLCEAG